MIYRVLPENVQQSIFSLTHELKLVHIKELPLNYILIRLRTNKDLNWKGQGNAEGKDLIKDKSGPSSHMCLAVVNR